MRRSRPTGSTRRIDGPLARFELRDLVGEALAGMIQRPGRALLTILGTVLGVGSLVAVLGLTTTVSGQIGRQFSLLQDTTVTVNDTAGTSAAPSNAAAPNGRPAMSFPADADSRAARIDGVVAAGVWWQVPAADPRITAGPGGDTAAGDGLKIYAATPGAIKAMDVAVVEGVAIDPYDVESRQRVAMLSALAADRLGVFRLDAQPTVFIDGVPYTVIGIYNSSQRVTQTLLGVIVPSSTALDMYGNPDASIQAAQMVVATRAGAAQVVADQIAPALRPDAPRLFSVTAPPDPHGLKDQVTGDLGGLFLALAAICLIVGAFGIANTTLVSVLERTPEIGLRRALGARARHIAGQFLAESTLLGTVGGLIGTALGVVFVLIVALAQNWTAVLQPAVTLPAPLIGSSVGMVAGAYPAMRAALISPLAALRA